MTFLFAFIFSESSENEESIKTEEKGEFIDESSQLEGIKLFDEPGDIMDVKSLEVFQVIADGAALARCKKDYLGPVYLIINKVKKLYYDNETIKVPKGKVLRQIGIYQYPNRDNIIKTVPVVMIMDN